MSYLNCLALKGEGYRKETASWYSKEVLNTTRYKVIPLINFTPSEAVPVGRLNSGQTVDLHVMQHKNDIQNREHYREMKQRSFKNEDEENAQKEK